MTYSYVGSHKVVFLGNPNAGKTSIVQRYISDEFEAHEPTLGASYNTTTTIKNNCKLTLEIWDTAGQERYRSLVSMYLRDVSGILLIYDLSDLDSFKRIIDRWICYIDENMSDEAKRDLKLYIVGNKSDMTHNVRSMDLYKLNTILDEMSYNYVHFKVSAKVGTNIGDLFTRVSNDMIEITKKNYNKPIDSGVIEYIFPDDINNDREDGGVFGNLFKYEKYCIVL